MSEQLPQHHSPEHHHDNPERERSQEKAHLKELQEKAEHAENIPKDAIESIKKSIESSAVSGKEYGVGEKADKAPSQSLAVTKSLKKTAYKRTLKKVRTQLSAPEKALSTAIHNPTVDKVSEVAGKTVARPSGILFGGIGAFAGSLFLLIISKRSGFTYNYLAFVLIFVAGYFVGLIVELFYRALRGKSYR